MKCPGKKTKDGIVVDLQNGGACIIKSIEGGSYYNDPYYDPYYNDQYYNDPYYDDNNKEDKKRIIPCIIKFEEGTLASNVLYVLQIIADIIGIIPGIGIAADLAGIGIAVLSCDYVKTILGTDNAAQQK